MSWVVSLGLGVLGLVILFWGITVGTVLRVLLQPSYCNRFESKSIELVPEYVQELCADAIATLTAENFQVISYNSVDLSADLQQWQVYVQDASQQIHVSLSCATTPGALNPLTITLSSVFADDSRLMTINAEQIGLYPPNPKLTVQHEAADTSLGQLLHIHRQQLQHWAETRSVVALPADQYLENVKAFAIQEVEWLIAQGHLRWVDPQVSYRMSWRSAFVGVLKSMGYIRRYKQAAAQTPPSPVANQLELEWEEFQRRQARNTQPSRRMRQWLFLGSLGLFMAVYAASFEPQQLLVFVAVLLLHEGGHVLAMKICGYRDAAILFIPYMGALATARKDNASLTEKVWISLAGPLPGLVLGIGLAIAGTLQWLPPSHWLSDAILYLVLLNLFNLLPVYPLDGGQVADLLLFSRHPYLGVGFKGVGVVLLACLSLLTSQHLLLVFALLIGLSIPSSFQLAKLNRKLRQEQAKDEATAEPEQSAHAVLARMQKPPYHKLHFNQKYSLVQAVLESRQEGAANRINRLGLSAIYLVSLAIGLVGGGLSFVAGTTLRPLDPLPAIAEQPPINVATHPYQCSESADQLNPALAAVGRGFKLTAQVPAAAVPAATELSEFFSFQNGFEQLRAPWDSDVLSPEVRAQQAKARYTYAQIMAAQERQQRSARFNMPSSLELMVASMTGNHQWQNDLITKLPIQIYERNKQAVLDIQARNDPEMDSDMIALVLKRLDLEHEQMLSSRPPHGRHTDRSASAIEELFAELEAIKQQLEQRLGQSQTVNPQAEKQYLSGQVRQTDHLIDIDSLYMGNPEEVLPAITGYLCEHQFSDIRYDWLEPPSEADYYEDDH